MSSFRISEVDEEAREELLKLRRSGLEENEIKEDYERGRWSSLKMVFEAVACVKMFSTVLESQL